MGKYRYLSKINSPADLKKLPDEAIVELNGEIRDFLVDNVSKTGGHLASNLGVVELSVALHKIFESPKDHIIWDVGHQSYVHKILTGRRDEFNTLRAPGGISGFPKISESKHDAFGTGHSSTSISAALGFAEADKLQGSEAYTIAVVGDGAFTGGMIHEGLNNCKKDLRLIIVLNENEMSISKNIGSFAKSLSKLRINPKYYNAKRFTERTLRRIPLVGKHIFNFMLKAKKVFKNIMYGSNYFEDLGLYYIGPVDGNDYESVEKALNEARAHDGSSVVHIKTVKGKGYEPAEKDPSLYHGVSSSDAKKKCKTFSEIFGESICELAQNDKSICAITAAMCDGTGLTQFKDRYPDRFFDVGIAEGHAVTFAAGLAADGMRPVVAIYSTFLQRAYDNIIHDVALQSLPVVLCIDRAGLNNKDGATHHGIFDVAFLSHIPDMEIYTPVTENGLRESLKKAVSSKKPAAIRYASDGENELIREAFYADDVYFDTNYIKRNYPDGHNADVLIISYGRITIEALKACEILKEKKIECAVMLLEKLSWYNELASNIVEVLPRGIKAIVFLEEGIKNGGAAMLLSDILLRCPEMMGIKSEIVAIHNDFVIQQSKGKSIFCEAGISAEDIVQAIDKLL